jgi:hypothetical protein
MKKLPFQEKMIKIIRQQVPEDLSLSVEVGKILGVSADSAYRRLRCETAFTIDEMAKVCLHFLIPLETLSDFTGQIVSFKYKSVGGTLEDFKAFLKHFQNQINTISKFEKREVMYAAEDIPLFHIYALPVLSKFKFYYWRKAILNHEELADVKFNRHVEENDELNELAKAASIAYASVPSTEIWTEETIASTIQQIKFFWDAALFETQEDAEVVIKELEDLVRNLQRQCDLGLKFLPGGELTKTPFTCYASDLMIGNNCVLVKTGEIRTTFLGYNTFNFMNTNNPDFNKQHEVWMNNLISKSTQISRTSEKIRNLFFKALLKKVADLKKYVEEN